MHQKHTLLGFCSGRQCVDHWLGRGCRIVADPEFEQVTQDNEFEMTRRVGLHETEEPLQRCRPLKRKMQVRNKDRVDQWLDRLGDRQRWRWIDKVQINSARSTSTLTSGTS